MSPVRKYLDSRGYQYAPAVVIYAEIVFITIVAAIVLGGAAIFLLGQYRSADGLSAPEITMIVTGILTALNQLGIWRLGAQNKAIGEDVNGNLDRRLAAQTTQIDADAKELHKQHKQEREEDADVR